MTAAGVAGRSRLRRHWRRLVIPYAVLLLLGAATWLAYHQEEPNLRDSETLSPASANPDGSSRLAGMLAARGVEIMPASTYAEAHEGLASGSSTTVFIPKPTFAGAVLARDAARLAGVDRIVVVAPSQRELAVMRAPMRAQPRRWAARAESPGCDMPEALAAGRATTLRSRYTGPDRICYAGGLARAYLAGTELLVVGATDPFRNRRIGEHGNAVLALELLAASDVVLWVDALPADLHPSVDRPGIEAPARPEAPSRPDRDRTSGNAFEQLLYAYPSGILAALVLAMLLAVLVALARARRLGPPVMEPLPVVVPAAEAVAGRGRLYHRAKSRGAALETLRVAARQRLMPPGGNPTAELDEDAVVATVAARSGLPAEQVRRTLYGPAPERDEELTAAVAALDQLVAAVTHDRKGTT